jgi:hypothetical protein
LEELILTKIAKFSALLAAALSAVLFAYAACAAQPNLDFKVKTGGGDQLKSITITVMNGRQVLQTITHKYDTNVQPIARLTGEALFTDVNFDGYGDLLIYLGAYGTQGVRYYACWLWDADKGKFSYVHEFQNIEEPMIDKRTKEVSSFWRNSAASHSQARYSWVNGKPVMQARLTEDYSPSGTAFYTEERLKDGSMQTVLKNVPISEIDSNYWSDKDTEPLKGRRIK